MTHKMLLNARGYGFAMFGILQEFLGHKLIPGNLNKNFCLFKNLKGTNISIKTLQIEF